jgi:predicted dinucleotide-binding enzyme
MKIAVLGSGNIGGSLGRKWSEAGHRVVFGTRDPESPKLAALLATIPGAQADSLAGAIASAEVVLFAQPSKAVPETAAAHARGLDGKMLIDATNNFSAPVINQVQTLRAAAPQARIYRAFNTLGWEVFAAPVLAGVAADLFFTGPDGSDRKQVEELIGAVGLRPIWVGDNDLVAVVDAMGQLWVTLVFQRGWKRRLALKAIMD